MTTALWVRRRIAARALFIPGGRSPMGECTDAEVQEEDEPARRRRRVPRRRTGGALATLVPRPRQAGGAARRHVPALRPGHRRPARGPGSRSTASACSPCPTGGSTGTGSSSRWSSSAIHRPVVDLPGPRADLVRPRGGLGRRPPGGGRPVPDPGRTCRPSRAAVLMAREVEDVDPRRLGRRDPVPPISTSASHPAPPRSGARHRRRRLGGRRDPDRRLPRLAGGVLRPGRRRPAGRSIPLDGSTDPCADEVGPDRRGDGSRLAGSSATGWPRPGRSNPTRSSPTCPTWRPLD